MMAAMVVNTEMKMLISKDFDNYEKDLENKNHAGDVGDVVNVKNKDWAMLLTVVMVTHDNGVDDANDDVDGNAHDLAWR